MTGKSKKRSRDQVVARILQVCVEEANKTKIVYQANLNFHTIAPHLNLLIEEGLIEVLPGEVIQYKTTQKGIDVLGKLEDLQRLLGEKYSSY